MQPRILLVDDDALLRESLSFQLEREGFAVVEAATGHLALQAARRERPALVVLDIGLPDIDGLELCRRLQAEGEVPVVFLTARNREIDRLVGLNIGGDDYVTKPFSTDELIARIRAVLRRARPRPASPPTVLEAGGIRLDPVSRRVSVRGTPVALRPKEFELLRLLMLHRGEVLTRDTLLDQVWGPAFCGDVKTLAVHIRWLRQRIEEDPDNPRLLHTVRGVGYRFEPVHVSTAS